MQQSTPLEMGKPVARELLGGDKHTYQMMMTVGQYSSVLVEQRGVDVLVRVLVPDGNVAAVFDQERSNQGQEPVELVAETTGTYVLIVESKLPKAPAGTYEIRLTGLRSATAKERALHEARGLIAGSTRLRLAGKYDEALVPGGQALEIRERELGSDHRDVAVALNLLAILYRAKDENEKAESLHRRALAIQERVLGLDHPDVAATLNNLGLILDFGKGDYAGAQQLYQRALAIWQKTLGPEHPYIPAVLNNIAIAYVARGDFVKAEPLYQRALGIQERLMGREHPDVARSLNNLAELYRQMGDFTRARLMYERSLAIYERELGPEHPDVADLLSNLALVVGRNGDFQNEESLHLRALTIREKVLGPEHSRVADTLNNLAVVYFDKGEYARAEPLYKRALAIEEKVLGANHPNIITTLNNLVALHAIGGDTTGALAYLSRYLAAGERNLELNLTTGSERQKLAYLGTLSAQSDWAITLHTRFAPGQQQACDLAATTIIQRKGRVQDALADGLASLRRRFSASDQGVLDRLSDTTAKLARAVLDGPRQMTHSEYQQQITVLEEERERLEIEINRRSAGYYDRPHTVGLADVEAAIPADAALIEFAVYRPYNPKTDSYDEPRYVAYVLRRQGQVQWNEIGSARALDDAIADWRGALRDPRRKDVKQLARDLGDRIINPLRPLLGDVTRLLISPDGQLNLIPFEALIDEQNRYLVESFACTYLTSGRDLLRLQVQRESKSDALVLANPLFGVPQRDVMTSTNVLNAQRASRNRKRGVGNRRQSLTTGSDLSHVYFAPLDGTAREAQTIKSLFAETEVLTGIGATESSIKKASAPRILHIATHGFFLSDRPRSSNISGERTGSIDSNVKVENPLLRSGLAFAGANLRKSGSDDGILTAMEASGLNLWGTKLVTLSACDTGIGEVKNGEGVYGLRRAFVLAGTETLVMSLWPVSDYVTREIMTAYYTNMKQGQGRGAALRHVQLAMLKRPERAHPFYWASFVQAGEWGGLNGNR